MSRRLTDPNARKALAELKVEIATELGIENAFTNHGSEPITNVFKSSRAGSIMTKKLVESEQKDLFRE